MKNTIKIFAGALLLSVAVLASCNKPAENTENDGKDTVVVDTTSTVPADTTATPADTTVTAQ